MRLNQRGGANLTAPTVIILGFILFVVIGYLIFGVGGSSNEVNPDEVKVSKVTTPTNVNSGSTNDAEGVIIPALNIRINDPDKRQLVAETINIPNATSNPDAAPTPGYYVRDSNTDFYTRCKYPVRISLLDEQNIGIDANDRTNAPYIKNLNGRSLYVGLGTYDTDQCPTNKPEDISYIADLRQYVANNIAEQ